MHWTPSGQEEGTGLKCSNTESADEHYVLSGVVGRLVDAPRQEKDPHCMYQNGIRCHMTLTSVELVDGACDQCQRFLSPASKGIGVPEGCGDVWCPVSELPRAAEMEASL
jgi:hypothetical protein